MFPKLWYKIEIIWTQRRFDFPLDLNKRSSQTKCCRGKYFVAIILMNVFLIIIIIIIIIIFNNNNYCNYYYYNDTFAFNIKCQIESHIICTERQEKSQITLFRCHMQQWLRCQYWTGIPHASAAYVQIFVFNRKFPESLGTSKMMVKFQYLVHKSGKRSQRLCIHINEIYINFIRIKFCRNSHQRLNRLLANGCTIAN